MTPGAQHFIIFTTDAGGQGRGGSALSTLVILMESILTSKTPDHFQGRRPFRSSDHNPIPLKYHKVLSLHLAGHSNRQICEQTGYKSPTVYAILADKRVIGIRQQLLAETEKEFEALYPKAVDNLRQSMSSDDLDLKLKGTDMWMRAAGKYQKSEASQTVVNVTAEDIVFQILNNNPQGQPQGQPLKETIECQ